MSMFKMCLNWKVLAALVGVGLVVLLVAPNLLAAVLPLLLLAACPLSMLVMMGTMSGMKGDGTTPAVSAPAIAGPPEHVLAELHVRLGQVQAEQETLARTIAQLETGGVGIVDTPEVARALAQPNGQRA